MTLSDKQMAEIRDLNRTPEVTMCMHDIAVAHNGDPLLSVFKIRVMGHMLQNDTDLPDEVEDYQLIAVDIRMDYMRVLMLQSGIANSMLSNHKGE